MEKEITIVATPTRGGDKIELKGTATFTAELPALPEDAATKTYVLKAVNGVLTWVVGA